MNVSETGLTARQNLASALQSITDAVGSTLGPGGRPFGYDIELEDLTKNYTFSKDGITILRSLDPVDPVKKAVLEYAKQAASHSVVASGDGTTSTIVLANEIVKYIQEANPRFPQAVGRYIESEAKRAIEKIKCEAIKNKEVTRLVALTSANGDNEIANYALEANSLSSAFGSIVTIKNPASKIRYKVSKTAGYSYVRGYAYNTMFAESVSASAGASQPIEWENPYVLLFNGSLMNGDQVTEMLSAWQKACESKPASLFIVAYEVGEGVINKLFPLNRKMASSGIGVFVSEVNISAEFNAGPHILRDIASFCGIQPDKIIDGGNIREVSKDYLGRCDRLEIGLNLTIFEGRSENHWVEKRVKQNENIVKEARSDFDKDMTSKRNAELAEGLVKVEIGSGMLPDLQERAARFDDASKAAKACLRNGALPGAGASYIRAANLANMNPALKKAFRAVYNMIWYNYGALPEEQKKNRFSFSCGEYEPEAGKTRAIQYGVYREGSAQDIGVLDAFDTVSAVIKNGVSLGVQLATIGGYHFRSIKGQK